MYTNTNAYVLIKPIVENAYHERDTIVIKFNYTFEENLEIIDNLVIIKTPKNLSPPNGKSGGGYDIKNIEILRFRYDAIKFYVEVTDKKPVFSEKPKWIDVTENFTNINYPVNYICGTSPVVNNSTFSGPSNVRTTTDNPEGSLLKN